MLLELFLAALDIEMSIRNTALTLSQRRLAHLVRSLRSFNFVLVSSHRRRMRSLFDTQIILALLQLGSCLGMSIDLGAKVNICLGKTTLDSIVVFFGAGRKGGRFGFVGSSLLGCLDGSVLLFTQLRQKVCRSL